MSQTEPSELPEIYWTWTSEEFSAKLFAAAGIVIAQSCAEDHAVELEVRGLCGAIRVEVSHAWVQQACEATHETLIAIITASWWYREYLEDVDFSLFRKSELFHTLICDFILPTQIATGLLWSGNAAFRSAKIDTEALELSFIRHTGLKGERRLDRVRGAIPAYDEINLWDGSELAAVFLLDGQPLSPIVDAICEDFMEMTRENKEEAAWLKPTYIPGNPYGVRRPTTYTEMLKYHKYAGISSGGVWSDAEGGVRTL